MTPVKEISEDILQDFISPQLFRNSSTINVMGEAFQKGVIGKVGKALAAQPDLTDIFNSNIAAARARISPSSCWWQPEAGAAVKCSKDGNLEAAALHLALSLYAQNIPGSVSIQLDQIERFSVGGHVFSLRGRVSVNSTGTKIAISDDVGTLRFVKSNNRWVRDGSGMHDATNYSAPIFLDYAPYAGCYVQGWIEPIDESLDDFVVPWPPVDQPDRFFSHTSARSVDGALTLLEELSPKYTDWLRPLMRGVAASPQKIPGMMQSGSYTYHAGVFNCGFPRTDEYLSEVIVHEMSHQYYLLFSSVFPFVKPGENKMYYSAFKNRERPLDRLLLSFHAAANMTLYWQDLIEYAGSAREHVEPFEFARASAAAMQEELRHATGLTGPGELLLSRQSQLLIERGLIPGPQ